MKSRWVSPCRSPSIAEQQHFCGPDAQDSTEEGGGKQLEISEQVRAILAFLPNCPHHGISIFSRFQANAWLYIGVTPVSHKTFLQTAWRTPERLSSMSQPFTPKSTWPVACMKSKMLISEKYLPAFAKGWLGRKTKWITGGACLATCIIYWLGSLVPFQSGSCESTAIFT